MIYRYIGGFYVYRGKDKWDDEGLYWCFLLKFVGKDNLLIYVIFW